MIKTSDICILISVAVAFVTTAFLWFQGVDTRCRNKTRGIVYCNMDSINFNLCYLF